MLKPNGKCPVQKVTAATFHDPNVRHTVMNKDSELRHKILSSASHFKHKVGMNHVMKILERFWDSVANADKKRLFGLKDLLKSFLTHVIHQEIPIGQQIITWKIITVVIILLISIRTALPVIETKITRQHSQV
jgi:hypothetical protein